MNSKSSSAVASTSNSSRELRGDKNLSDSPEDCAASDHETTDCTNGCKIPAASEEHADHCGSPGEDLGGEEEQIIEHLSLSSAGENGDQLPGEKASGSPGLLPWIA